MVIIKIYDYISSQNIICISLFLYNIYKLYNHKKNPFSSFFFYSEKLKNFKL